ncbi:hypothetical protein A1O3_01870 [Capronia epimyces CBS 606.96]|uniref:Acyl-CoA dehydrogenase/oxidase C-terminal domain-containing protein n=1 Tax=Capronia epimyces CBS 606.96 TaxID=1182542 RepID=W9YHR5_9EURO|nr:uncharacterized protein A1O3_01870 [Capronia epimyces CBS 606.96]EXJ88806.1 hypothetical protein A1O3_01870 [Capronia epimyces CBS 606.96]
MSISPSLGHRPQNVADLDGDEYVISGEKCMAYQLVDAAPAEDVRGQSAIIIVTRDDIAANRLDAYSVVSHPETLGHKVVNGSHIRSSKLVCPKSNLPAPPGKGADVVEMTFTASAVLVWAIRLGIMRQSSDRALAWAKHKTRRSKEGVIQKQSVADLLIRIKTRCEASRALVGKPPTALAGSSAEQN